jgi:hypothetical protein
LVHELWAARKREIAIIKGRVSKRQGEKNKKENKQEHKKRNAKKRELKLRTVD